jgi:hypothetical protein
LSFLGIKVIKAKLILWMSKLPEWKAEHSL